VIHHACAFDVLFTAVAALAISVVGAAFRAHPVAPTRLSYGALPRRTAAGRAAVAVPPVVAATQVESGSAARTKQFEQLHPKPQVWT